MNECKRCGSHAINHHCHGRDGTEPELCDVCYWRKRAEKYQQIAVLAHDELLRGNDDATIIAILERAWK